MKTAEIASAPAKIWNEKNQPSEIERFEESPRERAEWIGQIPFAAAGILRRNPAIALLSAAAIGVGAIGLAWFFSGRD